jgi:hypothetical protein
MDKENIEDIVTGLSPSLKKDLLNNLVKSLLSDLKETEKKELIQKIVSGGRENRQVIDMVEHWITECTDSGVNPIEMSKEVITAISHSYELASYSTPELRGLFDDWLNEIEKEILAFLKDRNRVDYNEIAQHFRLKHESVIFILGKLAREGKINMQASGN